MVSLLLFEDQIASICMNCQKDEIYLQVPSIAYIELERAFRLREQIAKEECRLVTDQ